MSIESNKVLVQRWIEAWIAQDIACLDQLFAANYTVNERPIGVEGVRQAVLGLHAAFGEVSGEVAEVVADQDKVVVRWTLRGRHVGKFMGIAPTGKAIELSGINIYQIQDGRIVANHEQTNAPSVFEALKRS